jgi:hypothetical protein
MGGAFLSVKYSPQEALKMNYFRFTLIAILSYFTLTQGFEMANEFKKVLEERTSKTEEVLKE